MKRTGTQLGYCPASHLTCKVNYFSYTETTLSNGSPRDSCSGGRPADALHKCKLENSVTDTKN